MKRQEGFTLIELMVVILIIGILVAIAVPVFFSARSSAEVGACQDNMRTIDGSIMTYSAATGGGYPANIAAMVPAYLREAPECPAAAAAYTLSATTPPRAVCPHPTPHSY
jgi:prepilin-type N-terminal cleavage/methylation domain-containing protein